MKTQIKNTAIWTLSFQDRESGDYVDGPMKYCIIYYSEDDAITSGQEAVKGYPRYMAWVNYGEYETPEGDILGEVYHALNIDETL